LPGVTSAAKRLPLRSEPAATFNSLTSTAVAENFRWQADPAGNCTDKSLTPTQVELDIVDIDNQFLDTKVHLIVY